VRRLFEAPTVADLAIAIVQKQSEQVDEATLDEMLADLEQLSDAKAREAFSAQQSAG
jgi:hypothetical protein